MKGADLHDAVKAYLAIICPHVDVDSFEVVAVDEAVVTITAKVRLKLEYIPITFQVAEGI